MSEYGDRDVSRTLGKIEALLTRNGEDVRQLSTKLLGESGDGLGGIVGAHNERLQKLEVWYIRVTAAVVVWTFMTGSGPVNLASILQLFHKP